MSRLATPPHVAGVVATLLLIVGALFVPLEVRHSAPFGFSLTLDSARRIAVRGGVVTANYPNFNRVDLDLRAYDVNADYDLTVHIRPVQSGAPDVRTVMLPVPGQQIRHDKPPFANPYLSISFPPIADSAGRQYYVWIDAGPRNWDDVVTLWSVKSYSRVTGRDVIAAALAVHPAPAVRAALVGLMIALAALSGWLFGALVAVVARQRALSAKQLAPPSRPGAAPVGPSRRRIVASIVREQVDGPG